SAERRVAGHAQSQASDRYSAHTTRGAHHAARRADGGGYRRPVGHGVARATWRDFRGGTAGRDPRATGVDRAWRVFAVRVAHGHVWAASVSAACVWMV